MFDSLEMGPIEFDMDIVGMIWFGAGVLAISPTAASENFFTNLALCPGLSPSSSTSAPESAASIIATASAGGAAGRPAAPRPLHR